MFTFSQFLSVYEQAIDPNIKVSQDLSKQIQQLDLRRARLMTQKAKIDELLQKRNAQRQRQSALVQQNQPTQPTQPVSGQPLL